jgi:tryptophan-rich sensory protein
MTRNEGIKLVFCVLICEGIGIAGAFLGQAGGSEWYASLKKPDFQPPAWVFAPVWTVLYFLMGISAFLVWRKGLSTKRVPSALLLFLVQLVLNGVWSILFFRWHRLDWAMAEIVILWLMILLTLIFFSRISSLAAVLLIPYIAWVSFATVLIYRLRQLNP